MFLCCCYSFCFTQFVNIYTFSVSKMEFQIYLQFTNCKFIIIMQFLTIYLQIDLPCLCENFTIYINRQFISNLRYIYTIFSHVSVETDFSMLLEVFTICVKRQFSNIKFMCIFKQFRVMHLQIDFPVLGKISLFMLLILDNQAN